ncbi:PQQ-binding-like beta-propeller repeat protein [Natrinema sp. SYSU A 869]|uniref:outer membrane protein assembly factor BamB family protein n=1 Tax=Natrinema sp. SYSU A 869 TaxID=2871694 RepID=UPI001CA3B8D6|nr:PQQ-binding-like beta-propeller repeat protein [Natrinema sp. SYSU A 869]
MSEYARRNVLRYAGLTLAVGTGATTGTVAAQETDAGGAGDNETAGGESTADESTTTNGASGWSSIRGDAGNTGFVPGAAGPKSPVAVDWEYDHGGTFAVVDGTVYLVADDGQVRAIDAADGSLHWETEITTASREEPVVAMGPPAVAHDTVYVTSKRGEPNLTALDVATGEPRWQKSDLGSETNLSPTVADGLVFLVADKVLYALDAHSGEQQWQFEPGTVTTDDGKERGDYLQRDSVAVANGTVFALGINQLFALDIETGDERWTDRVEDWASSTFSGRPVAANGVVAAVKNDVVTVYDAETGTKRSTAPTHSLDVLAGDRVYAVTDDEDGERKTVTGYDSETGDRVWQPSDGDRSFASAVVDSESVYVGLEESGVAAFDRTNGSGDWHVDTGTKPRQVAVVGETVYVSGDALFAIRTDGEDRVDEGDDGDENTSDDGNESTDAGNESADAGNESADAGNESTDAGNESADAGNEPADAGNESAGAGNESIGGSENEAADNTDTESSNDSDETPGFTAGTSIGGGALALEWLRRRTDIDE